MISITAEYALRAVSFLGREPGRAWTTQQVADATQVPVSYLSKVLQALVRSEIIQSVRGIYGGYQLSNPPTALTALEVINSVDPIRRIRRCPLGLEAHGTRLCPLHRRIDEAIALAENAFAETSMKELLAEPQEGDACAFPVVLQHAPRGGRKEPAAPKERRPAPPPREKTVPARKRRPRR